jgi:hypothetical protein
MNLSSLVQGLQDLEMLLFIYILFQYGLYLSSSFIVFRISLFRFYKLGRSMSFISLKLILWLLNLEGHMNRSIPLHPDWFKSIFPSKTFLGHDWFNT